MLIIGARLAHLSASIHPAVVVSGVAEDHEILVTMRGGCIQNTRINVHYCPPLEEL